MEPTILRLPERRVGQAVDVLIRAFRDDPVVTFFLDNPSRRTMAFRAFFGNIVRGHLRFAHVYAALVENQVAGVAVWRPPEAGGDTLRDRVRTLSTHLFVRSLFPRTAGDLFRGLRQPLRFIRKRLIGIYFSWASTSPCKAGGSVRSSLHRYSS